MKNVQFLTRDMYDGALADMNLTTDPFTGAPYAFGNGNPISNIELDGHMFPAGGGAVGCPSTLIGCPGYQKPPVTLIGTVLLPSNYPHLQQIQHVYNQMMAYGVRNHMWPAGTSDPSIRYSVLFLTCEYAPAACGNTLTNALAQAGPTGTAGAGNGVDPRTLQQDAPKQLLRNSVAISAAVGGLSALVRALGASVAPKTVAIAGGTRTLSGWGKTPAGFSRVSPEDVFALQEQMGFPTRAAGFLDRGVPGRWYATHAERQAAILQPNTPVEVSKEMCPDCQAFLQELANYTGVVQQVTDPSGTSTFDPTEPIEEERP